jgi:hypothetical protein
MKSSTRTTLRKAKKKWSRLEWLLLLLAPLLIVNSLAMKNFAPQVKRSFQDPVVNCSWCCKTSAWNCGISAT